MLYGIVRKGLERGDVSLDLSPEGTRKVTLLSESLTTRLAIYFLSSCERIKIAEIAKKNAIEKRDAGTRPELNRKNMIEKLTPYNFPEIDDAMEILRESDCPVLALKDVREVWDRVSVALDHHDCEKLPGLMAIEKELSLAGRFGDISEKK